MKYELRIKESCKKAIKKKTAKNKQLKEAISKKIKQILQNPEQFKPLKNELSGLRRVHIMKSFVLIYKILEENKSIEFVSFTHHDEAYKT
ncbi:type II toxin-antitoxin system mRNA interferase toxin, RelE/StbE family [Candidatus Woesearchaeota archaeon]|nr:type II toxin-antitoxin system mRNA interferase toxin, RelE/StbE family [Candidatus Woesearchaeota archaeon]MCF7900988.1 type II toxin-antitoxin system mRNA interferase toxin, RelE/StbE family [Candidatus Woesearchaeota archaeon]MCF8013296.1 type II toxin-antitoxin system mRNA interferase toxin, RelE/StbE family [Candidatus Woesearchaeota archaeon]